MKNILVAAMFVVGCGKGSSAPAVKTEMKPLLDLPILAPLAANDTVESNVAGVIIHVADRFDRRGGSDTPVYVDVRNRDFVPDNLAAAKAKMEERLGRPGKLKATVETETADGWDYEYKETDNATAEIGSSIGRTIGGVKVVCWGSAYHDAEAKMITAMCKALQAAK
jgi:hypothetical protein